MISQYKIIAIHEETDKIKKSLEKAVNLLPKLLPAVREAMEVIEEKTKKLPLPQNSGLDNYLGTTEAAYVGRLDAILHINKLLPNEVALTDTEIKRMKDEFKNSYQCLENYVRIINDRTKASLAATKGLIVDWNDANKKVGIEAKNLLNEIIEDLHHGDDEGLKKVMKEASRHHIMDFNKKNLESSVYLIDQMERLREGEPLTSQEIIAIYNDLDADGKNALGKNATMCFKGEGAKDFLAKLGMIIQSKDTEPFTFSGDALTDLLQKASKRKLPANVKLSLNFENDQDILNVFESNRRFLEILFKDILPKHSKYNNYMGLMNKVNAPLVLQCMDLERGFEALKTLNNLGFETEIKYPMLKELYKGIKLYDNTRIVEDFATSIWLISKGFVLQGNAYVAGLAAGVNCWPGTTSQRARWFGGQAETEQSLRYAFINDPKMFPKLVNFWHIYCMATGPLSHAMKQNILIYVLYPFVITAAINAFWPDSPFALVKPVFFRENAFYGLHAPLSELTSIGAFLTQMGLLNLSKILVGQADKSFNQTRAFLAGLSRTTFEVVLRAYYKMRTGFVSTIGSRAVEMAPPWGHATGILKTQMNRETFETLAGLMGLVGLWAGAFNPLAYMFLIPIYWMYQEWKDAYHSREMNNGHISGQYNMPKKNEKSYSRGLKFGALTLRAKQEVPNLYQTLANRMMWEQAQLNKKDNREQTLIMLTKGHNLRHRAFFRDIGTIFSPKSIGEQRWMALRSRKEYAGEMLKDYAIFALSAATSPLRVLPIIRVWYARGENKYYQFVNRYLGLTSLWEIGKNRFNEEGTGEYIINTQYKKAASYYLAIKERIKK